MADTISSDRRSKIMSHIKSKDTSIEMMVRRRLFAMGYRYRVNYKALPGKPDIVFTKKKIAIFIHGCYWHGMIVEAGMLIQVNQTKRIGDLRSNGQNSGISNIFRTLNFLDGRLLYCGSVRLGLV